MEIINLTQDENKNEMRSTKSIETLDDQKHDY